MLFDTSVLIAHLRGDERATDLLLGVETRSRLASVLTRVEIEGGMRTSERASVAGLIESMRLVPVTDAIARRAGEHLRRYRRSHPGIDLVDYVIAATAGLSAKQAAARRAEHRAMLGRWLANHEASEERLVVGLRFVAMLLQGDV